MSHTNDVDNRGRPNSMARQCRMPLGLPFLPFFSSRTLSPTSRRHPLYFRSTTDKSVLQFDRVGEFAASWHLKRMTALPGSSPKSLTHQGGCTNIDMYLGPFVYPVGGRHHATGLPSNALCNMSSYADMLVLRRVSTPASAHDNDRGRHCALILHRFTWPVNPRTMVLDRGTIAYQCPDMNRNLSLTPARTPALAARQL